MRKNIEIHNKPVKKTDFPDLPRTMKITDIKHQKGDDDKIDIENTEYGQLLLTPDLHKKKIRTELQQGKDNEKN